MLIASAAFFLLIVLILQLEGKSSWNPYSISQTVQQYITDPTTGQSVQLPYVLSDNLVTFTKPVAFSDKVTVSGASFTTTEKTDVILQNVNTPTSIAALNVDGNLIVTGTATANAINTEKDATVKGKLTVGSLVNNGASTLTGTVTTTNIQPPSGTQYLNLNGHVNVSRTMIVNSAGTDTSSYPIQQDASNKISLLVRNTANTDTAGDYYVWFVDYSNARAYGGEYSKTKASLAKGTTGPLP